MRRKARPKRGGEELFAPSRRGRTPPFAFVLEELDGVHTHTRPMFGCTAIYVDELIVLDWQGACADEVRASSRLARGLATNHAG